MEQWGAWISANSENGMSTDDSGWSTHSLMNRSLLGLSLAGNFGFMAKAG